MSLSIGIALVAALLAGAVSGLSGFGYALVGAPLLLLVFEPTTVVVTLASVGIILNLFVVLDSLRIVDVRVVVSLLPWSLVGLVIGVEILKYVQAVYIELAVGLLVLVFSLMLLRNLTLPGMEGRWGPIIAGASSGAMASSTGLGGPPIVMLFVARKLTRDIFRASNGAYFFILACSTFSLLSLRGVVAWEELKVSALLIPAVLIGKMIGTQAVKHLSSSAFRTITVGIMLAAGSGSVVAAGWELLGRVM